MLNLIRTCLDATRQHASVIFGDGSQHEPEFWILYAR